MAVSYSIRSVVAILFVTMCRRKRKIKIVLCIICNFLSSTFSVDNDLLNVVDRFAIFLNQINGMIDELVYLEISLFIYISSDDIDIICSFTFSGQVKKYIRIYTSKRNRFRTFGTEPKKTQTEPNRSIFSKFRTEPVLSLV